MISSPTEKQQKNTEGFVETKIAKAKGFLNDFFPSNWIGSGIRKMAWDPQKKRKPKKMFDPDFQWMIHTWNLQFEMVISIGWVSPNDYMKKWVEVSPISMQFQNWLFGTTRYW